VVKAVMDRVFIRLDKQEEVTKGGIILAETIENPRTVGVVESIGDEVTSVKVGERVLCHCFDELPTYDPDVVVVRENSILGVFEDDE
jgi:co-chaperonin GroES (HSP10)